MTSLLTCDVMTTSREDAVRPQAPAMVSLIPTLSWVPGSYVTKVTDRGWASQEPLLSDKGSGEGKSLTGKSKSQLIAEEGNFSGDVHNIADDEAVTKCEPNVDIMGAVENIEENEDPSWLPMGEDFGEDPEYFTEDGQDDNDETLSSKAIANPQGDVKAPLSDAKKTRDGPMKDVISELAGILKEGCGGVLHPTNPVQRQYNPIEKDKGSELSAIQICDNELGDVKRNRINQNLSGDSPNKTWKTKSCSKEDSSQSSIDIEQTRQVHNLADTTSIQTHGPDQSVVTMEQILAAGGQPPIDINNLVTYSDDIGEYYVYPMLSPIPESPIGAIGQMAEIQTNLVNHSCDAIMSQGDTNHVIMTTATPGNTTLQDVTMKPAISDHLQKHSPLVPGLPGHTPTVYTNTDISAAYRSSDKLNEDRTTGPRASFEAVEGNSFSHKQHAITTHSINQINDTVSWSELDTGNESIQLGHGDLASDTCSSVKEHHVPYTTDSLSSSNKLSLQAEPAQSNSIQKSKKDKSEDKSSSGKECLRKGEPHSGKSSVCERHQTAEQLESEPIQMKHQGGSDGLSVNNSEIKEVNCEGVLKCDSMCGDVYEGRTRNNCDEHEASGVCSHGRVSQPAGADMGLWNEVGEQTKWPERVQQGYRYQQGPEGAIANEPGYIVSPPQGAFNMDTPGDISGGTLDRDQSTIPPAHCPPSIYNQKQNGGHGGTLTSTKALPTSMEPQEVRDSSEIIALSGDQSQRPIPRVPSFVRFLDDDNDDTTPIETSFIIRSPSSSSPSSTSGSCESSADDDTAVHPPPTNHRRQNTLFDPRRTFNNANSQSCDTLPPPAPPPTTLRGSRGSGLTPLASSTLTPSPVSPGGGSPTYYVLPGSSTALWVSNILFCIHFELFQ